MISESIQDIVTQSMQGDAQALQSALDVALREKINAALEEKKHDISKNLVGLGEAQNQDTGSVWNRNRKDKKETNKKINLTKSFGSSSKNLVADKKLTNKQRDAND